MGHAAGSLCSQSGFAAGSRQQAAGWSSVVLSLPWGRRGGEWLSQAKIMICQLGLDLGLCL